VDPLSLLLFALSVWRVSSLLLYEDGPGEVFARVRTRAGADTPGEISGLAQLWSCMWCMSMWVAILLSPLLILGHAGDGIMAVLSASAVAIFVHERVVKH
jgi:hypothetical protein